MIDKEHSQAATCWAAGDSKPSPHFFLTLLGRSPWKLLEEISFGHTCLLQRSWFFIVIWGGVDITG